MSREAETPQELKSLEAALGSLKPAALRVERDQLMYQAGQAAVPVPASTIARPSWFWPASTAGMSAVAATLLMLLVSRPAPQVVERVVYLPAKPSTGALTDPAMAPGTDSPPSPPAIIKTAPRDFSGGLLTFAASDRRPEYLQLRDQVLAFGVDTWQKPVPQSGKEASSASYRESLNRLLNPDSAAEPAAESTSTPSLTDGAQL
jgi:hypothetical protein